METSGGLIVIEVDASGTVRRAEGLALASAGLAAARLVGHRLTDVLRNPTGPTGPAGSTGPTGATGDVDDGDGEAVREAEARRRRSEARLREAQRIAHVGSWEWDVASNHVEWTDEMYNIYGLARGDLVGSYESFLERVLPEDREHTRTVVFDAFRSHAPFVYDHRVARPDGSVRMLHTRGAVFTDAAGKVSRMAGACWDVTDLWQRTQERERAFSLLRATLKIDRGSTAGRRSRRQRRGPQRAAA